MNPYAAPQKEGYHMIQSLLSFATGGVTGRGLGNGIQKLGYLPEDTTDFIFSVICEELGFFGALFTVALFLGIIYVTWQAVTQIPTDISQPRKSNFGRMLAFGIGSMVGLQAMINIAVATVSVPTKGLSLPLVSAGGSGLVITGAALGLLLSICRYELAASGNKFTKSRRPPAATGRFRVDSLIQGRRPGSMSDVPLIIMAGGGTGGHLYPGVAVAQALRLSSGPVDILFLCTAAKSTA
jgi:hypothetical protein